MKLQMFLGFSDRYAHTGAAHTTRNYGVGGKTQAFPGFGVGEEVVWGLTYRMLELFFSVLDPEWQGHD